jgi:hypothetical protein
MGIIVRAKDRVQDTALESTGCPYEGEPQCRQGQVRHLLDNLNPQECALDHIGEMQKRTAW